MRPYGPKINGVQQSIESTLAEFRELVTDIWGEDNEAVTYLDQQIAEKGADFEVDDSMAFRDFLTPMMVPRGSNFTLKPLHQHLAEGGDE